jgi:hypothetical protein
MYRLSRVLLFADDMRRRHAMLRKMVRKARMAIKNAPGFPDGTARSAAGAEANFLASINGYSDLSKRIPMDWGR